MVANEQNKRDAFARLLKIMDELRAGCPWDKKQTWESLRNLTIEETYELADALTENDAKGVKEELGDIFLHLVFYAKIGEEQQFFDVSDVLNSVCDKLIARHPHIYGDVKVNDEEDVKRNWEKLKLKEGKKGVLSGVPTSLPALIKAYRMQEKTAKFGFEWENASQVWDKVEEEIGELKEGLEAQNQNRIEDEFGDVLFSLINYARFINVDPENALERTNRKFKSRFEFIESHSEKNISDMSLEEMELLWKKAKVAEQTV